MSGRSWLNTHRHEGAAWSLSSLPRVHTLRPPESRVSCLEFTLLDTLLFKKILLLYRFSVVSIQVLEIKRRYQNLESRHSDRYVHTQAPSTALTITIPG